MLSNFQNIAISHIKQILLFVSLNLRNIFTFVFVNIWVNYACFMSFSLNDLWLFECFLTIWPLTIWMTFVAIWIIFDYVTFGYLNDLCDYLRCVCFFFCLNLATCIKKSILQLQPSHPRLPSFMGEGDSWRNWTVN